MDKNLDLVIVDAIRSIVENTEHDVIYDIRRESNTPWMKRNKVEVISVNITLTRVISNDAKV